MPMNQQSILLSFFEDAQRRLDDLYSQFPGAAQAIDAAFHEGWTFYIERGDDLELLAGAITPQQFAAVKATFDEDYYQRRRMELQ